MNIIYFKDGTTALLSLLNFDLVYSDSAGNARWKKFMFSDELATKQFYSVIEILQKDDDSVVAKHILEDWLKLDLPDIVGFTKIG